MRPNTPSRRPANRHLVGAGLALLGMLALSLAVALLCHAVGSWQFGVKIEEGDFPPGSQAVVQWARLASPAAAGLIFLSAGLASSAVAVRPHPLLQLLAATTLLALLPALLLLWLGAGIAF